ncbi:MAG: hypothetical protein A2143_08095 [Gallionellales bacterium RBG_16_57_15]|nr:MAG: hypothetical protein A2143_08095 [Gallionellales bacterium RBG_16_57_15]
MVLVKGNKSGIVITDIQMQFMSMVEFMVKAVLAAIPALLILAVIGFVVTLIFSAMLRIGH